MYVLGRQKQINMPSIWDGRQWSDVIDGDTGNSLLLSHIFVIQFFFFTRNHVYQSSIWIFFIFLIRKYNVCYVAILLFHLN